MTDLQVLSELKRKPTVTNCYMLENEIFNTDNVSKYDIQIGEGLFCLYKNTNYHFKQMCFYINVDEILANKAVNWKEKLFVTEIVSLEKKSLQTDQVKNWLVDNDNFHYRTFLRMFCIDNLQITGIDFSSVQNPKGDDFESIKHLLEKNFDIYAERIPSVKELKQLQNSTYVIKHHNQIAAILISDIKGKTEELRYWLVMPEFRNKGYGSLLMKYFLNCYKGTKRYTLWVDSVNENAINKYQYYGFVKDRITNTIYINKNIMRDIILEILEDTRPEFDFKNKSVSFMEAGYLDSFDVITIVADLESAFDVKINGALIVPESFQSVESIMNLIENSKNAS